MFRRGLAVLLCSAMLVGSLPETSFAAESSETTESVTAETETAEAEPEKQAKNASTETEGDVQASQAAVPETQTVSGTEKAEAGETVTTEAKETEAGEPSTTEGTTDASVETATTAETVTQEEEKTEATEAQTVTGTEAVSETESVTETQTVTETATETEETVTAVETEEASTEGMTEEETATEEIENAETQSSETLGNEYVTVSNVKTTYNSISFDYEILDGNVHCIFLRNVKGYGEKYVDGKGSISLDSLNPETEYQIAFCGYSPKESYYEFSQITAKCPYSVKYNVASTKADEIILTAEITERADAGEYKLSNLFYLHWKLYDKDGNLIDEVRHEDDGNGDYDTLPVNITAKIKEPQYIFGNTKYTLECWIEEAWNEGSPTQFAKESGKEVTTAAPVFSDLEITFKNNGKDFTKSEYTLTTGSYKDSVDGTIFWRTKGYNEGWEYTSFSTENGSASGEIDNLCLGSTYEYFINAGGLTKTDEFTNGEAKLKWDVSFDMGALDAVATFKLDETTKTAGATYDVYAEYKKHTDEWWNNSLDADDEQGVYIAKYLYPNIEYDIRFVIDEYLPDNSRNTYTAYETVKTKECAVNIKNIKTYLDAVEFEIYLDPSVRTEYTEDTGAYPYIKNQDGTYTRIEGSDGIGLAKENGYGDTQIWGLESNKVYEISFGVSNLDEGESNAWYAEYGTMTFKTPADDRVITIDEPEIGVSKIKINGTFVGSTFPYDDSTNVVFLCKEQGVEKWKYMDHCNIDFYRDEDGSVIQQDFTFSAELEAGKSYEYAVGICDSYKDDIDSLKNVKKGTITLKPDERSVEIKDTVQLLNGVVLKATLLGKYIDEDNAAYLFFREKGKADAAWETECIGFGDSYQREGDCVIASYNGEALKPGTTYEYKYHMNDNILQKEEEFAKLPISGEFTFTPPTDNRALKVEVKENNHKYVRFMAAVTGNKAISNVITIFYREKGSESWQYSDTAISWRYDNVPTPITVWNLTENTEYEYIIGISNTEISSPDKIVAGKQEGSFALKDDIKFGTPDIATGYSYADIKVGVEGLISGDSLYVKLYTKDTAQKDAKWISRNSYNVYYYYEYNYNTEVQYNISGLEQGITYDYALVLADSRNSNIAPDTEAYEKLSANRKLVGTFSTRRSDYKLDIAQKENSKYRKEILTFKALNETGFNDKMFTVQYTVTPKGETSYVTRGNVSLSSVDYTADVELINLKGNAEYTVTATLYACTTKPGSSQIISEVVATKEYSLKTTAANAPAKDDLKVSQEELWLNSWDEYYSYAQISVTAPEGVSNEVVWKSGNEEVAGVLSNGIIMANKPGETTITATSKLNSEAVATVTVHVKNYGAILTTKDSWEPAFGIYMFQNKQSDNVAFAEISDDGKIAIPKTAVGVSDDPSIAVWDNEKQCVIAKNVGTTYIVLDHEGYKSELTVVVYADAPDFDVKLSPTTDDMDYDYPAIKDEKGTYQIAALGQYRNYYQLKVEANPKAQYYDINDVITVKVDDKSKDVLKVDEDDDVKGLYYVKGLKKGPATVTVSYDMEKIKNQIASLEEQGKDASELKELAKHTDLDSKTKTIKFDVRPLYSQEPMEAHAISNVHKTLKDVKLGEDWVWRDPETPLYSLPESGNQFSYEFEAKYTGAEFYNYEGTVEVTISTIAGVDVTSDSNVISTSGDSMNLTVKPIIYGFGGLLEKTDYQVSVLPGDKDASIVSVAEDAVGYKVTANKKGKYTLKPEIKIGSDVVAVGSYTFTAVDGKLVDYITVEPVIDNKYVTIKGNMIYFDTNNADVKEFKLQAKAFNRGTAAPAEENKTTKLTWTITDKTIADIDAKTDDRNVTVKIKGDGHAVIQVTAADEAKASSSYKVEARNREPRVEGDKVTINTAYDYQSDAGVSLSARQYGYVSITSVYGEDIDKVQVMSSTGDTVSTDFKAVHYSWDDSGTEVYYVIAPVKPDMAKGKHDVRLAVTTSSGFTYTYPLAVTVDNKEPKVTAKFSNTMNLFYLDSVGTLDVTLEANKSKGTNFTIESLKWSDSANKEGFQFSAEGYSVPKKPTVRRYTVDGSKVKVSDGKLANPNAASGTVTIKLAGVIKEYKDIPVTVKYSYKKPKLTTADSASGKNTSMIIPSMGGGSLGQFRIYADKKLLAYDEDETGDYNGYGLYNVYRCGNDKVAVTQAFSSSRSDRLNFTYFGTEEKFDIPLTIDSLNWREALTVTHQVKAIKPTAVLSNAKLVYNTKYNGEVAARVTLKDYPNNVYGISGSSNVYSVITAVDVAGADAVSQELLTSGKLQIEYTSSGYVTAKLNASKLNGTVPKGASYVLTPYYYDTASKGNKALNTLSLKISFTDKPIAAKLSGKGKLDITIRNYDDSVYDGIIESWHDNVVANSIAVTAKFANLGSGYYVYDARLTGEYSRFFQLYKDQDDDSDNPTLYIKSSDEGRGRLKAGQNYNLSITYTLRDQGGNRITVEGNVLKVKPIQKAPKITVSGNNKSLYMASPSLYRLCEIWTPYYTTGLEKDYYIIKSAYGSIDTNKDGKADIEVKFSEHDSYDIESGHACLRIQLTKEGRHSVVATTKGKSYTVPVTVQLEGRDGITKDATISIKVTVKK